MAGFLGKLIIILSGEQSRIPGIINYQLIADLKDGSGNQEIPFSNKVGDKSGLGAQVDEWLDKNPNAITVVPFVEKALTEAELALATQLTSKQLRRAIMNTGRGREFVKNALTTDEQVLDWEHDQTFQRKGPVMQALQAAGNFTDAQADTFWIGAATLPR